MEGTVASFLPSKGYGFILGDDGCSYFLHQSDIAPESGPVVEGQRLIFEESATPKGYRARRVRPVSTTSMAQFVVPDAVLHSREAQVKGWETIEASRWAIVGSSRESPDSARSLMLANARRIGANGVIHVQYFKTRGSEAGTGRGTHYFTIHNFKGHPVSLGRRSVSGTVKEDRLKGVTLRASELKSQLEAQSARSRRRGMVGSLSVLGAAAVAALVVATGSDAFFALFAAFFGLILSVIVYQVMVRDYDSWLIRP